jgi:hypothetical protein
MDFNSFLNRNPIYKQGNPYPSEEIKALKGKVPDDLLQFMTTFGRCTFANGFFSTVYPGDIDSKTIFKEWGFKKGEYYIFLKSCFGLCVFYHKGSYHLLDGPRGEYQELGGSTNLTLNFILTGTLFVDEVGRYDIYMSKKKKLAELKQDEIYMLVPALPLGGSFEKSKLEPGKMLEHLCLLAQLCDNKAKAI